VEITADQLGPPVDLRSRFAPQRDGLLALLASLDAADWQRPTACTGWSVADLAAHVLGDVVGRASGHAAPAGPRPAAGEPLPVFIDRINEEWVAAWRRADPRLVVSCLRAVGPDHDAVWMRQDLFDDSVGVSWAGIDPAPLWFDAARDLTEYWVHERQIRDAVGRPVHDPAALATVLDVFVRGLPYTLARSEPLGVTGFRLVADVPGASWALSSEPDGRWRVTDHPSLGAEAPGVEVAAEHLWRRWTRQPDTAGAPGAPGAGPSATDLGRAVLAHVAIVHSAPDA
jgi:uncharacterized protein (TIGR03083 family)